MDHDFPDHLINPYTFMGTEYRSTTAAKITSARHSRLDHLLDSPLIHQLWIMVTP